MIMHIVLNHIKICKLKEMNWRIIVFVVSLVVITSLGRVFAPIPNFTPLGAVALLGGAIFTRKWMAFFVPILALWLSNLFLNNLIYQASYDGFVLFGDSFLSVAVCMILIAIIGRKFVKPGSVKSLLGSAIAASLIFYLVTNFAVWMSGTMYPTSFFGLLLSYFAGLPFLLNSILGDLFYSLVLFGASYYVFGLQPSLSSSNKL